MKKAISIIMLLGFVLLLNGFKVKGGENEKSATLTVTESEKEAVKKEIIEKCGLDEDWTTYMAVNGYVCGDYLYFYRGPHCIPSDVYRIGRSELKVEKYLKEVWTPKYEDNFIIFNKERKGIYARNLETGQYIKLTSKNNYSKLDNVAVGDGYICYVAEDGGRTKLYSIKCDGSERKKITSNIPSYNYIKEYDGRVYYMKYYQSDEIAAGYKLYSVGMDGTGKKYLGKIKTDTWGVTPYSAELRVSNGELLLEVRMPGLRENDILYRFNGQKFKKLGLYKDFPEYDENRLSDGYKYRVPRDDSYYYIVGTQSGLRIERAGLDGEWEVFTYLPYFEKWYDVRFDMQNGYLICYFDEEEPQWVLVFDPDGNLLIKEHIAGYTDEAWMYAVVTGDKVYILHDSVLQSKHGVEQNVCEVIDLNDLKVFYDDNSETTIGMLQEKMVDEIKAEGLDCAPGSSNYYYYVEKKLREEHKKASYDDKKAIMMRMYMNVYMNFFEEYLNVIRKVEYGWDELEEFDVDAVLEKNDCIIFDPETELYYFEPSESFLSITVKDIVGNKDSSLRSE